MKFTTRTWIILIAGLFVLSAAACGTLYFTQPKGQQVVVTVNSQVYGTYDLHRDRTVVIAPADKSWYNTLQIHDGKAAVIESDCSNQICVMTPALCEDYIGLIVCLPHGVVVELRE